MPENGTLDMIRADAVSNSRNGLWIHGDNYVFNGTTWDRQRGTSAVVILASGARTPPLSGGACNGGIACGESPRGRADE